MTNSSGVLPLDAAETLGWMLRIVSMILLDY